MLQLQLLWLLAIQTNVSYYIVYTILFIAVDDQTNAPFILLHPYFSSQVFCAYKFVITVNNGLNTNPNGG